MSNPGAKPFVLTGNIAIDSLILRGLAALAAVLTGIIMTWLNAKGFQTTAITIAGHAFSVAELLTAAILSALASAAALAWGYITSKINVGRIATAGAQLVLDDKALLDEAGRLLPITQATAPQIVKDYAPATVPKTS